MAALPAATAPFVMLLLLLVPTGGCSDHDQGGGGGGGCFGPLIGCAPAASATGNATAFRASLVPLLAALPSATAAAAHGFAALHSQLPDPGRDHDRAHAFGLCFGFGGGGDDDALDCHACLRAAVAVATEGCANDTRRAGVLSDSCLLAYYDAGDIIASSYTDGLEQTLADLATALAQPKGQSLWRKAKSIMLFVLAAIGAVTVVVLLCVVTGCYLLAEALVVNMAAAGPQGDGLALYVAGTNGQAHVWSVTTQVRFH